MPIKSNFVFYIMNSIYSKQLIDGCGHLKCSNTFCNIQPTGRDINAISKELAICDEIFTCKNFQKLLVKVKLKKPEKLGKDSFLNILFEVFDTTKKDHIHSICMQLKDNKTLTPENLFILEAVLHIILMKNLSFQNQKIFGASLRIFILIYGKTPISSQIYDLLPEIFMDIQRLSKFIYSEKDKINFKNSRYIKSRIMEQTNVLEQTSELSRLQPVDLPTNPEEANLKNLIFEKGSYYNKESNYNKESTSNKESNSSKDCIFSERISVNEFSDLIRILQDCILSNRHQDFRRCTRTKFFLNILLILYNVNERHCLVSYELFYMDEFCRSFDLREEYKLSKLGNKSLLDNLFVMPLELKAEYVKLRNSDKMKNRLQDAFFRALFEGKKSPYFYITIRRSRFFEDTMEFLLKNNEDEAQKQLKIIFKDEEGVDSGGITKEYFQLLSEKIITEKRLFTIRNNNLWFRICWEKGTLIGKTLQQSNSMADSLFDNETIIDIEPEHDPSYNYGEHDSSYNYGEHDPYCGSYTNKEDLSYKYKQKEYEVIGKLIGISLYNDVVLNLPFPTFLFKKLIQKRFEPSLEDLKEIDPQMYRSLLAMRDLDDKMLRELEQNFVLEYSQDGFRYSFELVPGGRETYVNKKNVEAFIGRYVEFFTRDSVEETFGALKRGFFSIISFSSICFLQPRELEKIIVGSKFIDLNFLKKKTIYTDFLENSQIIVWFWDIVESYSEDFRAKLLQFITGNNRVPVSGLQSWRLIIMKNGADTDRLPSSQTCFNTLLLPEYSSRDKLEHKLNKAVCMTKGFFLL